MDELYAGVIVIGLMAFDVLTGYLAALKNKSVSSSVMRTGVFKKAGSTGILLMAYLVAHLGGYIGFGDSICAAVYGFIVAMLAVMETTSILENICKLNEDLPITKIFSAFGVNENDQ